MITFKKKFDFLATDNELGSYISSMLEVVEGDIDPQIEFDVESDDKHRYVIVNILDKVLIMKNKKNKPNAKQKTLFIIIGALVGVFLIYTLFLSPYAQCVSGYIKTHDWNSDKSEVRAEAKITCKALGR